MFSMRFRMVAAVAWTGMALGTLGMPAMAGERCPLGIGGAPSYTAPVSSRVATPAGLYAIGQVDAALYRYNHANLLYTHYDDSRFAPWGAQHDPARDNIQALFTSYGLPAVQHWFTSPYGYQGCNVVAQLTGTTRPQDIYILGAHYDSFCYSGNPPGADDNASGVAAILELARLAAQWGSEATIRFIAFDMEEWGLIGSDAYAGEHAGDNILGMISMDMMAYRATPHNVVALASRAQSEPLRANIVAALADYSGLAAEEFTDEFDRSDHAPFEWRGFQATWLGEPGIDSNPYYHNRYDSVDTYAYIDYEYTAAITRGVLGWLVETAGIRPTAPVGDLNCDYRIDFDDIDPFVLALAGEANYVAVYPDCRWLNADTNGDFTVDFADIDALVSLLTSAPGGPAIVAQLVPADAAEYGNFGNSMALSGDTLVVGAYGDDDQGATSGAGYVYERSGDAWVPAGKWVSPWGAAGNCFGYSVAVDADVAVLGAPGDDTWGTDAGSAQVVERVGGTWTNGPRLRAQDATAGDMFGFSVAVHGDIAVVGAPYDNVGAASDCGSAYVFQRVSGVWTQVQKLTPPDGLANDWFGYAVASDGNTLLIGAPGDDEVGTNSGSVSVYTFAGGSWTRVATLAPGSGPGTDQFGTSLAIRGDVAVIAGYHLQSTAGSAYVFERVGEVWTQTAYFAPWWVSGPLGVALDADTIVLGRPSGDVPLNAGRAYVYERRSGQWTQVAQVAAPDGMNADGFGGAVAVEGNTAAVGAAWRDAPYVDCGSAYIVELGTSVP